MRLLRFEHNKRVFIGRLHDDGSTIEVLQDVDAHDPMIALLAQTLAGDKLDKWLANGNLRNMLQGMDIAGARTRTWCSFLYARGMDLKV